MKIIMKYIQDKNARNNCGFTAVMCHCSAINSNTFKNVGSMLELLIGGGADVSIKTMFDEVALDFVCDKSLLSITLLQLLKC